jgi:hypothetical protein
MVAFFIYYDTVELGMDSTSPSSVRDSFIACDLTAPSGLHAYLSQGVKDKRFIKSAGGYRLQRHFREQLSARLGAEKVVAQTSVELRKLETALPPGPAKDFLKETIDCFEAGANRATIVMCWILAIDQLYSYILVNKLSEFNAALSKNTDKRVKVTVVAKRDDFGEMPESKFIEFCRSASIISNDVRKILDEKLGTRNSSAHPSGIEIKRSKVIDFVDDLVTNVVLKFKI